jgi:hypothetical protein
MRTPHLVPLSRQALAIRKGTNLVAIAILFSLAIDRKPMSENTVNKALRLWVMTRR